MLPAGPLRPDAADEEQARAVFDAPPGQLRVRMSIEDDNGQAIDSDVREGDRQTYRALIESRRRSEPYSNRHIFIDIRITPTHGEFVIRDEGRGFDPKDLPDPTDPLNMERPSGRGLLLMRTFMDDVAFNERGNQVTLVKRRSAPH